MKTCLKCGTSARDAGGRCKACALKRATDWYKKNVPRRKAYMADYYAKNAETLKAKQREWSAAHAGQKSETDRAWRSRNWERKYATDRARALANPEATVEAKWKSRAKLAGATVLDFTFAQWLEIKAKYGQLCAYCRKGKPLTIDHVLALEDGGQHTKENVVPACKSCNSSKKRTPVAEFIASLTKRRLA